MEKMNAAISTGYGGPEVFQIQQVDKPVPAENEVRVKIYASAVTTAGTMIRTGKPYFGRLFMGFKKPKNPIPGTGFAGRIDAVGAAVKLFKVGDNVFGETLFDFSTHAEYVCLAEDGVLLTTPENMTFEEGAPVCDGPLTVMNFLKGQVNLQPGQSILINGASGSLGTAAVQIAKYLGAEVTGVCSTANFDMVESLGADYLIDYGITDFARTGEQYDYIFDTVGKRTFADCKNALKENGVYLSPVLTLPLLFQMIWTSMFGGKKAKFSATGIRPIPELRSYLKELKEIFSAGKLKSIIDRRYTLNEIAEAHKYIDNGHKKGNVVISRSVLAGS